MSESKQYCRHCAFCIHHRDYSHWYYCTIKEKEMTENTIKTINHCKEFGMADEDVISGKRYKPRKKKKTDKNI